MSSRLDKTNFEPYRQKFSLKQLIFFLIFLKCFPNNRFIISRYYSMQILRWHHHWFHPAWYNITLGPAGIIPVIRPLSPPPAGIMSMYLPSQGWQRMGTSTYQKLGSGTSLFIMVIFIWRRYEGFMQPFSALINLYYPPKNSCLKTNLKSNFFPDLNGYFGKICD